MWGVALIFFSCVAARAASREAKVECGEYDDFPPSSKITPSFLADLKVEVVPVGGNNMLNISWAINIDASIEYLTGTRILVESVYHCEYNPPLAKTNLTGSKQKWFHYLVKARYDSIIQAANLPLPVKGSGPAYKMTRIIIPQTQRSMVHSLFSGSQPKTSTVPTVEITTFETKDVSGNVNFTRIAVAIFGGLAGLMILSFCYIIYKTCGATSLGFKTLPTSPMLPVVVVYPAENSAFQQAVVALAEFLQWHGGCSVAVDMWQQGKIAQLGPMRWLAEQTKTAYRVLIVCPQLSSQPSHSPSNNSFPEPSIPAAAHDLYPLVLNMVASHSKSASDLAKFWVVQLGEQQDKRHSDLALELRACKTFCLMKDLDKLCRSLHTQMQDDKKISDLIFRPRFSHSRKSTVKLSKAVEKLGRQVEPLKSVVTTI